MTDTTEATPTYRPKRPRTQKRRRRNYNVDEPEETDIIGPGEESPIK